MSLIEDNRQKQFGLDVTMSMNNMENEPDGIPQRTWLSYLFGKSKQMPRNETELAQRSAPVQGDDDTADVIDTPSLVQRSAPAESSEKLMEYLQRHSVGVSCRSEARGPHRQASLGPHGTGKGAGGACHWGDVGGNGKVVLETGATSKDHVDQLPEPSSSVSVQGRKERQGTTSKVLVRDGTSSSPEAALGKEADTSESTNKITGEGGEVVPPQQLRATGRSPELSQNSVLLKEDHIKGLMAAVPKRLAQSNWNLLYSTEKHGFSLQTLYRKAAGVSPTILVVREFGGYVFGAYCSEPWRIAPRFYGTGESFVFQIEPDTVYYPWKREHKERNDFFMYGSISSIGVGGTGHFALSMDGELEYGHSGVCDTFGSPCLASSEEFKITTLELWLLV